MHAEIRAELSYSAHGSITVRVTSAPKKSTLRGGCDAGRHTSLVGLYSAAAEHPAWEH